MLFAEMFPLILLGWLSPFRHIFRGISFRCALLLGVIIKGVAQMRATANGVAQLGSTGCVRSSWRMSALFALFPAFFCPTRPLLGGRRAPEKSISGRNQGVVSQEVVFAKGCEFLWCPWGRGSRERQRKVQNVLFPRGGANCTPLKAQILKN